LRGRRRSSTWSNASWPSWASGSTRRHLGWTRDFRTARGCRPNLFAPLSALRALKRELRLRALR